MGNPRRMVVLRAVVEDYIRSQEPVGSGTLARQHDLGVSSATVRNDMAALEDEGYLTQPHTSAGRVPTEKAYRYFVDRLSTVATLSDAQRRGIANFLSGSVSLTDTLQRAARLLAQITGQVAVVAAPSLARSTLRRVELVPVGAATLLAVVITDTGRVAQHTIAAPAMPADDALQSFVAVANAQCGGLALTAAATRVRALAAQPRLQAVADVALGLADALDAMSDSERAGELYLSGASSLAHQGGAIAGLAPLLDALEEQVVLMKLMGELSEEATGPGGVGVAIGSETHTPGLMNAAVVTSGYGRTSAPQAARGAADAGAAAGATAPAGGEPVAFVGSIGPTHMDYAATMAAVRAVARYLTSLVSPGGPAAGPGAGDAGRAAGGD